MFEQAPGLWPTVLSLAALSMLPFFAVMMTAYTKISIVLFLLRSALGVQQAPSGLVLNSVAVALTLFISMPLFYNIGAELSAMEEEVFDLATTLKAARLISDNVVDYIKRFAVEEERAFFMDAARKLWPEELHKFIKPDNFFILVPAHVVSELTRAFEIGFMLFLPFLIVDLVVSNILLAMGAMMVPPMLISLPIKILLFVAVDGWTRLLHSLILSYAI